MKDLLDFRLPPFFRLNWVNESAQHYWAPLFKKANHLWSTLEVLSVQAGLRKVALLETSENMPLPIKAHLHKLMLPPLEVPLPGPPLSNPVVIGSKPHLQAFQEAWQTHDITAMGKWLGYPSCCIAHFQAVYQENRLWYPPWAWLQSQAEWQLECFPETNVLLHSLGIRLVPHTPCTPHCTASLELSQNFQQLTLPNKSCLDLDILKHILSWPVEWSALHGIAEIKTPLFRISTDCAATGNRYSLQIHGKAIPERASLGIRFPFPIVKRARSSPIQHRERGINHPIKVLSPEEGKQQASIWDKKGPQLPSIDWERMAAPQSDAYDTSIILQCAALRYTVSGSPEDLRPVPDKQFPVWDQTIAICPTQPESPLGNEFENGPLIHPNLEKAFQYLQSWPEAYEQVKALVHTLHPAVYRELPESQWNQIKGSCSHCFQHEFGIVHATIHDPIALAQALVHEMAHMKLFALGVWKESTGHLILNPLNERYSGTIRTDELRPISALLHAQYAFIHVIQLNLFMLETSPPLSLKEHILYLLHRNVQRMAISHQTLTEHAKLDENGKAFMVSFMDWSSRMIEQANSLLLEN